MPAEKRDLELSKDGVAWYSQGSEQHGLGDVHLAKQGCKSTPVCQPFLLATKFMSGKGSVACLGKRETLYTEYLKSCAVVAMPGVRDLLFKAGVLDRAGG